MGLDERVLEPGRGPPNFYASAGANTERNRRNRLALCPQVTSFEGNLLIGYIPDQGYRMFGMERGQFFINYRCRKPAP